MIDVPMNTSGPISLGGNQTKQTSTCIQYGGVSLKKGQSGNILSKDNRPLTTIKAGLSWEASKMHDLDVECFLRGADGKALGDEWFVFYYRTQSPDGAVTHSGDCRDGSKEGDDEVITINLLRLDARVQSIVFTITIDEAVTRCQNFAQVKNPAIHIMDGDTNQDLMHCQLADNNPNSISMIAGEVYRQNGMWRFKSICEGTNEDLYELCRRYGVNATR